ncbi:TetR/AcrR family transcriptional regulator [Cupriavidus sp. D384]|uniref:TetR/AcrR family transcriptional regulator n=1 Tax=Cupriavidus sp. D384 TaxID=1538095 RepID=UPI000831825A|nr:TetR/AcrR family transcriptional regulator [Cupriavidus sp. D384]
MVRPPQQSRSEQNLAKMVAACRTLAEERGNLDDISLQDVVSAAKTSIGAFYSRFKDKEAFLNYVLEVALAEAETVTRASIATDAVWQDASAHAIVAHIVHFYVTQFRQNRGLFRGSLRHYAVRDPETNPMRMANRRIIGLAVPWLAAQLTDRTAKAAEFESRAAMQFLVGTLSNVLLNDPGPLHLDDDAIETHLVRMMNRYLGVPEPTSKRAARRDL